MHKEVTMSYDYSETIPYLLHWYKQNARILAWRENPKPYYVWVSEIMLQQTRVEAVKSYFDRFILALPDINSLASIPEDNLLKLWEGLGYYNRARNMQKAAQIVMKQHNGSLPADHTLLLSLPGIGSYTAGAIASIAFGLQAPAVDGNVLRVLKRIAGSFDDITKDKVKKDLEQDICSILPKEQPGDYNQALMELGATICLPNGKPLCDNCPVVHLCNAHQQHTELLIPVKPPKKPRRLEDKTVLLFEYQGKYAIQKRPAKGLLAGLFELPSLGEKHSIEHIEDVLHQYGLSDFTVASLGESKHIFSHIEWHMIGYHIAMKNQPKQNIDLFDRICWADLHELKTKYSLPAAFHYYSPHLSINAASRS